MFKGGINRYDKIVNWFLKDSSEAKISTYLQIV